MTQISNPHIKKVKSNYPCNHLSSLQWVPADLRLLGVNPSAWVSFISLFLHLSSLGPWDRDLSSRHQNIWTGSLWLGPGAQTLCSPASVSRHRRAKTEVIGPGTSWKPGGGSLSPESWFGSWVMTQEFIASWSFNKKWSIFLGRTSITGDRCLEPAY